jgi:hypothetical protein
MIRLTLFRIPKYFTAALLLSSISITAPAHDYNNLNEIMIDRANEAVSKSILQAQSFMTEIFQQRYKPTSWPDVKLNVLRNDLMHQVEEADMSLEYFASKGVNLQSTEILFDNPLAGRSVAASQGVKTTYELLKHINTLESVDDFIREIYSGGMSAQMYNLVTAYRQKMDLYREIFVKVPGPGQMPTNTSAASGTPQSISLFPYAIILALACIAMFAYLIKNKVVPDTNEH